MTKLRLGEAARRGKTLIDQGAIGRVTGFSARFGAPPAAPFDAGVMAGPGSALIDLLQALLGPVAVVRYADDARGGWAAEAEATLTAGGATGEIVLSRLRTLANTLTITGETGVIEIDLDGLDGRAATPNTALQAARREALPRPWDAVGAADPASPLRGRPVLVIGASGFIGSRLVEHLALEHGAKVTALVRDRRRAARIARLDVAIKEADLSGDLSGVVQGQTVVFNLAHDFRRDGNANLRAFNALAGACAAAKVDRFVHVSSIAVYDAWPGPDLDEDAPAHAEGSEYKSAKLAMEVELAARSADGSLPSVVVQPTIVYGPFSALWTDLPGQWLAEGDVFLPEPAGLANAVYVDDVVQGLIRAAVAEGAAGQRFILSGPEPRPWRDLFAGYAAALGRPEALKSLPAPEGGTAADPPTGLAALLKDPMQLADWKPVRQVLNAIRNALGEAAIAHLRDLVLGLRRRSGPVAHYPSADDMRLYLARGVCRIDRARTQLGYQPRFDLQAGLARTGAYLDWRRRDADE